MSPRDPKLEKPEKVGLSLDPRLTCFTLTYLTSTRMTISE